MGEGVLAALVNEAAVVPVGRNGRGKDVLLKKSLRSFKQVFTVSVIIDRP